VQDDHLLVCLHLDLDRQHTASVTSCLCVVVCNAMDGWTVNGSTRVCPAKPSAHWLMVAEMSGRVLMVPLAPARSGDPARCRPIGCYEASQALAAQYRKDRR
jgi:hypothetical protein